VRVWHVLRKPTREEVLMVAKVSAIGILIIGLLGFIISILMSYIVPR
ncbi:MAG TPA: protein translocase SEC61 complex subunit gamma, partial [Candidatus Nanoarchaeia archaeon]|nr:protein translocase SEC61 complex subunit gamma [Candidatus Nanoarchaeia archaeon]